VGPIVGLVYAGCLDHPVLADLFRHALTAWIFHWLTALSFLPGFLDFPERGPSALSLIIVRLGVRIILLGVYQLSFDARHVQTRSCPMVALN
jgi:hypothetical protein